MNSNDFLLKKDFSLFNVESINSEQINIIDFLTKKYDYIFHRNLYCPHNESLLIYENIKKMITQHNQNFKTPIITFSPDISICAATIAGVAEKFMFKDIDESSGEQVVIYKTPIKILYFSSIPSISTNLNKLNIIDDYDCVDDNDSKKYYEYQNSIISDITGLIEQSFSFHRVNVDPTNIYLIGIDEDSLSEIDIDMLNYLKINSFGMNTINTKGLINILNYIFTECENSYVHVVFDLSVIDKRITPSVYRDFSLSEKYNGFNCDQILSILQMINKLNKLHSIDIVNYNLGLISDKEKNNVSNSITINTISYIISHLIDLPQKKINIFNEDSRFLIWKRLDDIDPIGWLILRNIDLDVKEQIINHIDAGNDIITIPIFDENNHFEAFVTSTSMKEQYEKSYYASQNVFDCCLYPGEKLNMMFTLLSDNLNIHENNDDNTDDKHVSYALDTTYIDDN